VRFALMLFPVLRARGSARHPAAHDPVETIRPHERANRREELPSTTHSVPHPAERHPGCGSGRGKPSAATEGIGRAMALSAVLGGVLLAPMPLALVLPAMPTLIALGVFVGVQDTVNNFHQLRTGCLDRARRPRRRRLQRVGR
jgi:hypothetical protein